MFFSAFPVHRGSVGNSSPRTCFSILIKEQQFKTEIQKVVLPLVGWRGDIANFGKSLNQVMVFEKEVSALQFRIKEDVGQQKPCRRDAFLNLIYLDRQIGIECVIVR